MSTNNPASRPTAITALALAICALGIGQILCAGLAPSANTIGILSGAILFAFGIIVWSVKRFWCKEALTAYLYVFTGAILIVTAVNSAFGLGMSEFRASSIFVWGFVAIGLVFSLIGWLFLRRQSRK